MTFFSLMMKIGPSEKTMLILDDEITSTIIAQNVDLPTLLWSGSSNSKI